MKSSNKSLITRKGRISFPAYIPVTTFGKKYPLDNLVRPYLPRLAPAVMVSFHYARQMTQELRTPMWVDSGGFASLFDRASVRKSGSLGVIELAGDEGTEVIDPVSVLDLQEQIADVAFSLDFPIPPAMSEVDAARRMELTIANAHWALQNRRRKDLPLYACIQFWDADSARECAKAYCGADFDGFAIGGLVPRARNSQFVMSIVEVVRTETGDKPLHVFGLGNPNLIRTLYEAGVDSVDSSSYVKYAADGRQWGRPGERIANPSPTDRLHLALCNLATATGATLPLSASRLTYSTPALANPAESLGQHPAS